MVDNFTQVFSTKWGGSSILISETCFQDGSYPKAEVLFSNVSKCLLHGYLVTRCLCGK